MADILFHYPSLKWRLRGPANIYLFNMDILERREGKMLWVEAKHLFDVIILKSRFGTISFIWLPLVSSIHLDEGKIYSEAKTWGFCSWMNRDSSGGLVQLNFKENINQFHSVFEFYNFGYLEVYIGTLNNITAIKKLLTYPVNFPKYLLIFWGGKRKVYLVNNMMSLRVRRVFTAFLLACTKEGTNGSMYVYAELTCGYLINLFFGNFVHEFNSSMPIVTLCLQVVWPNWWK